MLTKYAVNQAMSSELTSMFDQIDAIFIATAGREGIITSANDGYHSPNSLHYKRRKGAKGATRKEAGGIDFRTRDMSKANIDVAMVRLKQLSKDKAPRNKTTLMDVIKEHNHIHCEIDPK